MEYWSVEKRYPPFNHYSLRAVGSTSRRPVLQYSNTPKLIENENHLVDWPSFLQCIREITITSKRTVSIKHKIFS